MTEVKNYLGYTVAGFKSVTAQDITGVQPYFTLAGEATVYYSGIACLDAMLQ
jgi:hypothetical protein